LPEEDKGSPEDAVQAGSAEGSSGFPVVETPRNTGSCILLSIDYDGSSGKALAKLYEIETGRIVFWRDNTGHKPYLLTDLMPEEIVDKYPDVVRHKGFDHLEVVKKYDLLNDREVVLTKVVARDPLSIGGGRNAIRDILPRTWESKIKYYLCYIYDRHIVPGMFYRIKNGELMSEPVEVPREVVEKVYGMYRDRDLRDEAVKWITLFQAPMPDIRRVAIDIEVYSPIPDRIPNPKEAKYQVICVAISSSDHVRKVFLLRRGEVEEGERPDGLPDDVEIIYYDDERRLIEDVFRAISNYPMLLTFNGDNFDLPYLYHRAKNLGMTEERIPITLSRDSATLKTGIHLDLYKFFSNRAMQVYAFSGKYQEAKTLDSISQALLGIGKIQLDRGISELSLLDLATYCFRDADLTLRLTTFDDNLVIKLMILMMRIAKLPIEDVNRLGISNWIKSMMYFEHRRRGYLIPNSEDIIKVKGQATTKAVIKGKKYLGAIVIDPVPGVFFNVVVVDFASLYPSVVKTWNLSYETVRCPHEECKTNIIPGTPHWVCRKRKGLSSTIIGFLRDFRVYIYKPLSKDKNLDPSLRSQYDVVQRALKVFINASYGVFGAEAFPLYCPPVAESTTALGRYSIYMTLTKAMEMGLPVLYGDTDSLFLWNPPEEKLEELFKWSSRTLGIDLDKDKVYRFVAFSGLKKNYLGIMDDGSFDIKGMVGKKRNTPQFIQKLFIELSKILSKLQSPKDIESVVESVKELTKESYEKLRKHEFSLDELAFRVALTKDPSQYVKNTPQHVKAARALEAYGKKLEAGDIISFVKVRSGDGVKPVQLARIDEVDEDKYVDYIETTFRQVLEAIGVDFDELMGSSHMDMFLK